jgi:hypothetical protein
VLDLRDLNMLILDHLRSINQDAGQFAAAILSNDISKEEQICFAHRLVDLAAVIRDRATGTAGLVVEGSVVDDRDTRELPTGER